MSHHVWVMIYLLDSLHQSVSSQHAGGPAELRDMQVAFWVLNFHTFAMRPSESTAVISQLSLTNAKQPPTSQLWHHPLGALLDSSRQA